jgi:hypothetical protein
MRFTSANRSALDRGTVGDCGSSADQDAASSGPVRVRRSWLDAWLDAPDQDIA